MQTHWRRSPLVLGLVLTGCATGAPPVVRPGIDVLLDDSLHLVQGRRVGLLTNQTGVDADGTDDIRRLVNAGVRLTAIFSPEHGFRGQLDQENIGHGVDSATGIDVYSLYGNVRAPTADMLDSVDVLLVDLQDIGTRTYTFVSTALLALRAAAAEGRPLILLDRPNPIGGHLVQGPVLDTTLASFIGMLPVPLRHGMTIGELVRFGNDVLGIHGALTVIPVAGWSRERWFDDTGLPWVRPSPSMPDLESATHYPGLVLFEATNLSVGRGTPIAFQVVAAPWLDAARLAAAVSVVPGVAARDTVIVPREPQDGKYPDQRLPAVRFRVVDRARYDPVRLGVAVLAALRGLHPESLVIDGARLDARVGVPGVGADLLSGAAADRIAAAWERDLAAFRERRRAYLLYPAELP
jgi:uncharacterized protein YbbC (DUF1343 family)